MKKGEFKGDLSVYFTKVFKAKVATFIERFWRTVKYEELYLHNYETVREARERLNMYFKFYNQERFHSSLNNKTPAEIYCGRRKLTGVK